ncbi:MAG: hypothetical protein E6Q33_02610 [Neisseriales bacterium]|nr:MAG: hypothetical protein E6Q33_02610 [Neisseriales bacterium]
MRIFELKTPVKFNHPEIKDARHGVTGFINSERDSSGKYRVSFDNLDYICHENFLTEDFSTNNVINSESKTEITVLSDVTKLVIAIGAEIKIDVPAAINYIDECVKSSGDDDIEKSLKKWFRDFAEYRLKLTRPINESLKKLIADEKLIEAHLNKVFADNAAKRAEVERLRREEKRAKVSEQIEEMKLTSNLPQEYLAKIIVKDEYLQVSYTGKKLNDDIQSQFDLQTQLKKASDDAKALEAANIRNRELLLEKLNLEYGYDIKYSQVPHTQYSDEQVIELYKRKKQLETEAQEKTAEATDNYSKSTEGTQAISSTSQSEKPQQVPNIQPTEKQNEKSQISEKCVDVSVSESDSEAITFSISGDKLSRIRYIMKMVAEKYNLNIQELTF